jgi:hypothetical protein
MTRPAEIAVEVGMLAYLLLGTPYFAYYALPTDGAMHRRRVGVELLSDLCNLDERVSAKLGYFLVELLLIGHE